MVRSATTDCYLGRGPPCVRSRRSQPLQPKSDISDLGQLIVPNSGKPEFGRGEVGAEGAG